MDEQRQLESAGGAPIASGEEDERPAGVARPASKASSMAAEQRVGSPQSYATTTSAGGLTNPTPTPSEMSQGSQGKKKKLKAKAVLKKFKFGSKKKSKEDEAANNNNGD